MKSIVLTSDELFTIEDKPHVVTLSVEYNEHARINYYWVSAVTETGLDLCNIPGFSYLKYTTPRNTRLRSEKSIVTEMYSILERYADAVRSIQDGIVLTERKVTVNISGTDAYGSGIYGLEFFSAASIYSDKSEQVISWYEHDVYNQGPLEVTVFRNKDGYLRVKADETKLYNTEKLQMLYNSERFQKSELAFFFYNEVRRLLGIPFSGHPSRMSGLFQTGVQE